MNMKSSCISAGLSFAARRAALALALALALGSLAACKDAPPRARQAQAVKLLPDTPPPPPPPPKPDEKRPEQRKDDKPLPQQTPRPVETPQAQALKTDEAPGIGPGSGLQSGSVSQDYAGGPLGAASQPGGPAAAGNRLAFNAYANAATRSLNEYLVREKEIKQTDYRLQVRVWLQPDGSMQRAELLGSTGQAELDAALLRALERFPGTRSPLPERMPQPLRLQISNRMIG